MLHRFLRSITVLIGVMALVALGLASGSPVTEAATLTVINTDDSGAGSLRDTIAAASNGDAINFDAGLGGQTISLTSGELVIDKTLAISGPAGGITLSGNNASRVFAIRSVVTVDISYLKISNGYGTDLGGGIFNDGTLNLTNVVVSHNSAGTHGGGIVNFGTLNLTSSTVSGNSAIVKGGGIANFGILNLTSSTVSGNSASGGSGISTEGTATLKNVTVSGNSAITSGGGIVNFGTLSLTNSTVSGNSASEVGGGIFAVGGTLNLTNSTVSGNSASILGGGIANGYGTVNLTNSIVAHQSSGGDCGLTDTVPFTSLGYNLDSDGSCNLTAVGDLPNTNPLLAPLALNAPGITATHALLAGSPAIDRIPVGVNGCGTTIPTDQRGVPRPQGSACDIGAHEVEVTVPTCDGFPATIVGTNGNDVLLGTNSNDVILALGGDDIVLGRNGNDRICLGYGNDVASGGNGNDRVLGEQGDDLLGGDRGVDSLDGGAGSDLCSGGSGVDSGANCETSLSIP